MEKKLTEKQKRFADEYLIDLNGTRAYKAAYPSVKKDNTAAVNANRLLRKTNIAAYIAKRQQAQQERTEITQDMVLRELAAIAFSDATDYAKVIEKTAEVVQDGTSVPVLDAQGNPVIYRTIEPELSQNLNAKQKAAISTIKQGRSGWEIKAHDKLKALELLGKHIGMFGQASAKTEEETQLRKAAEILGGIDSVIK